MSPCFNPLHCGAVVASRLLRICWRRCLILFQSPSLRGSGRFKVLRLPVGIQIRVSIPFIAGQWSLLDIYNDHAQATGLVSIPFIAGQWSLRGPTWRSSWRSSCLNPLHCGAVVASWGWANTVILRRQSLNPLHCGAVVASKRLRHIVGNEPDLSQSPSLRGSGRFDHNASVPLDRIE